VRAGMKSFSFTISGISMSPQFTLQNHISVISIIWS
jgi:hypothetical protein